VDRVAHPPGWSASGAEFLLDGLDAATASGVLTQWVLGAHVRTVLAALRIRSVRRFAKDNGLSEDRLHNFLNGNRIARFEDLAVFFELLGPSAWPDPAWVTKAVAAARARSAKKPAVAGGAGVKRYLPGQPSVLDMFAEASGPNSSSSGGDVNVTHPDSRTLNARFRKWVLAQPAVVAHLELEAGEKPSFQVRAVVCEPGQGGCDVWVGAGMVAGTLWAPADWKERVAGVETGAFLFGTVSETAGMRVHAARVGVTEDGPVEGDVSIVGAVGALAGGEIRWS
jgi:hypothetical protein